MFSCRVQFRCNSTVSTLYPIYALIARPVSIALSDGNGCILAMIVLVSDMLERVGATGSLPQPVGGPLGGPVDRGGHGEPPLHNLRFTILLTITHFGDDLSKLAMGDFNRRLHSFFFLHLRNLCNLWFIQKGPI